MNELFKLLPAQDVLELNKEDLEKYINQLNKEFIDLDFNYKNLLNENYSLKNQLSDIKTYVVNR